MAICGLGPDSSVVSQLIMRPGDPDFNTIDPAFIQLFRRFAGHILSLPIRSHRRVLGDPKRKVLTPHDVIHHSTHCLMWYSFELDDKVITALEVRNSGQGKDRSNSRRRLNPTKVPEIAWYSTPSPSSKALHLMSIYFAAMGSNFAPFPGHSAGSDFS
ncbi:uncharacterized protein ATNIH1004_000968 [Aspergillus tanneri]|uniref:Uncharacterized protein n=1 Tax=Aspergillus tanneri TaxID=1220188 RepID=A0A5M9N1B5_9EURO|nr:uncharacterized protein ATNIH1004_000968 [Aspergillus tanneri]KAA8652066.1 hypothetical protein ATNIH1004_000968 [Aspergillus tanneri]